MVLPIILAAGRAVGAGAARGTVARAAGGTRSLASTPKPRTASRGRSVPPRSRTHRGGTGGGPNRPGPSGSGRKHDAAPPRSMLDHLWTAQAAQDMASKLWETIDGNMPSFSHTISVAVRGGPEADLRRVWYLCVAAAFGRYRNKAAGVQSAIFEATWDVTGKACSVTIGYKNHGAVDSIVRTATSLNQRITSGLGLIQQGPDQVTIGGSWPAFLWSPTQSAGLINAALVAGGALPGIGPIALGLLGNPDGITDANAVTSTLQGIPIIGPFLATRLMNALMGTRQSVGIENTSNPWSILLRPCAAGLGNTPIAPLLRSNWGTVDVFRELPRLAINGKILLPWRRVLPSTFGRSLRYGSTMTYAVAGMPTLPDDGRVITTGEKYDQRVQPPRPPIDGISRASLVQLVAQGLQRPCFNPIEPPCSPSIIGSVGLTLYNPGKGDGVDGLNSDQIQQAIVLRTDPITGFVGSKFAFALSTLFTPDGYPTFPTSAPNIR